MINGDVDLRSCPVEGVHELLWPKNDYGGWHWPLYDWVNDKDKFMENVTTFDTVVQAGGCCGMYPRFYKNYFKSVWTFEPNPLNFRCLKHNCSGEGYHIFNNALGDSERMVSMDPPGEPDNVGMYTINETKGSVKMITLDSLNIPICNLLHLDLEGYESQAIKGALRLIERCNPVIIIERDSGREILESLGYIMKRRTSMDTIFVRNE
jgi:FkbM family methyltransferase